LFRKNQKEEEKAGGFVKPMSKKTHTSKTNQMLQDSFQHHIRVVRGVSL